MLRSDCSVANMKKWDISGFSVTHIGFGSSVVLRLSSREAPGSTITISIESPFVVEINGVKTEVLPNSEDVSALSSCLNLLWKRASSLMATAESELLLEFESASLIVSPWSGGWRGEAWEAESYPPDIRLGGYTPDSPPWVDPEEFARRASALNAARDLRLSGSQ